MKTLHLLSLYAHLVLSQSDFSNSTQTTDIFADTTYSRCSGIQTYTGIVPTSTVYVTVDGNYTYTGFLNDSTPTAAILYSPCGFTLEPETTTDSSTTTSSSSSSTSPISNSTTTSSSSTTPAYVSTTSSSDTTTLATTTFTTSTRQSMETTTYSTSYETLITSWTETSTSSYCSTTFVPANATSNSGPPYANTTSTSVWCSSSIYFLTSTMTSTSTIIFSGFRNDSSNPVATVPNEISSSMSPISQIDDGTAFGSTTVSTLSHPPIRPEESFTTVISGTTTKVFATFASTPTETTQPVAAASSNDPDAPGVASTAEARSLIATVTITKKTPVAAPPTYTGDKVAFPQTDVGSLNDVAPTVSPTTAGGNGNTVGGSSANGGNNSPTGGSNNPSGNNNNNNNNNNSPASTTAGGGGLGSIINSAFNSPFTSVGVTTSYGAASATVTLVAGVPVQVDSSSVYIGGSYVALPTGSSSAYVTVNGQTFTVGPSAVVGGSSTLKIDRPESISYSAVQAETLKASTITQNGIVVTIEPTAAVVSGTTYAIGLNAAGTTVEINGQTITLNDKGVVFASTTYAPAMTTAAAYVVTTIGDLTFSIDSSEAIISGTTYRIGAGALNVKTTAVIDGTTVTFGPSGVILPSTTIAPTGVYLTDMNSGSTRTAADATVKDVAATTGASNSGNAAPSGIRPSSHLTNTLCAITMIISLGTLPLSLFL